MAFIFFRRVNYLRQVRALDVHVRILPFSSRAPSLSPVVEDKGGDSYADFDGGVKHLSPLFVSDKVHLKECKIEIVDDETWQVSSGLAQAWWRSKAEDKTCEKLYCNEEDGGADDGVGSYVPLNKEDPDYDEIEDMRVRGNLFYKLDKDSKEYEEYKFDFHRRKSGKNKNDEKEKVKKKENQSRGLTSGIEKTANDHRNESKKREHLNDLGQREKFDADDKNKYLISRLQELGCIDVGKKVRTPTFNQLTAIYHEPFCLDIFVSKGSVRASVIHRATSKVVAVAHSISKDMKFDLVSTKSRSACAAVGEILAQRALADDIHNVVYTPRKGERLEGKLQIVLQAVIDNGINVKVKLKQRKNKTRGVLPSSG